MLVNVEVERICLAARVIGPQILLPEAHLIQRLRGQTIAADGERLRIGKRTEAPRHHAFLPPHIDGRADVAGRIVIAHAHGLAGAEREGGAPRLEPVLPDQVAMAAIVEFLALARWHQFLVARREHPAAAAPGRCTRSPRPDRSPPGRPRASRR